MNSWFLLNSGKCNAAFNMAQDEALLEAVSRLGKPVLRFYGWLEPAATFGYFQKFAEVERTTRLRPLIRRPTGGGIVPHDADWTYSLVFPPDHEWHSLKAEASYRRVHEWIQSAFTKLGVTTELASHSQKSAIRNSDKSRARDESRCPQSAIGCFAGYEKFDVLWHGKKIAGAAQRRNKLGLLIQGSVQPPPTFSLNPTLVGTSRCDVPARETAGGTVAPLNAARTAQRAVPPRVRSSKRESLFR